MNQGWCVQIERPTILQEVGDKESTYPYMQDVEGGGKGGLVVIGHVYCTAGAGVTVTMQLMWKVRFIETELNQS
jgi:hypothetical protein